MSVQPTRDVGANIKVVDACSSENSGAPSLITAAGTGDGTKVTGQGIDILGYDSCKLSVGFLAALADTETISFAVEYQTSDDDTTYDTAVVMQASTVAATSSGGSNERGTVNLDLSFDLRTIKQYIRFNITPDLSAGATDTATFHAVAILGGSKVLPAA